jgi:putative ABC transport system substrate-binding protein
MRDLGYIEGKNLEIEWRFADSNVERLSGLAAELVQLKVDAIVSGNTPPTREAQKATTAITIIMTSVGDPIGSGFVKSLAHPGGNITGLSILTGETSPKLLEMTLAMVPKLARVAVLINPDNADNGRVLKSIQMAAQKTRIRIFPQEARAPQDIDKAFATMARQNAGAVIVSNDVLFFRQRRQIVELAAKYRLPAMTGRKDNVEAGYLMSYGTNLPDVYRRAATFVDKIFKGAKPADLPVEQPTKFELIINGKTAKALGLKIPQSLLVSADKMIE